MGPGDVLGLLVVAFALTKILGPVGAAIGDRIRGRREVAPDPRLEGEVEELRLRLAEVEERLDFAERLLASKEPPTQLPGGAHR